MATSVAPASHQLATSEVVPTQSSPRQERRFAVLLVSALTLFALAIHGYHPYAEDGGLYLAGVKRLIDPTLYPHSAAFVMEPTRFSLFAPATATIVKLTHLSLPAALLALYLSTIWITLLAAWMLASRCWLARSARSGAVVLLACWLALPVAGTALVLMDPYLTARSICTPCTVLALVGMLDCTELDRVNKKNLRNRGLWFWIASISLAAAMHPLMAAYALGATLILACLRSSNLRIKRYGTPALSAAALVIAACLQYAAKPESSGYRRIALTRTYWFPAAWSWYELIGLGGPLLILTIFALRQFSRPRYGDSILVTNALRALALTSVSAGVTAWLIAMLFARAGSSVHLVARMQPLRIFHIVYLVMVLVLGATLGQSVLRRNGWRWAAVLLLLGGIMLTSERIAFSHSDHLELPWTTASNLWVQSFLWIRDHTPRDALFAMDSDYINAHGEDAQCFRAIAERSSLPDYSKDGGEAAIAPELTAQWIIGQQAQQRLDASATTDSMRVAALFPIGASWLVLDARATTDFACPYKNAAVKVCRLP